MSIARKAGLLMPRGPRGEKRPADTIGCAVMVAKIATGEIEEHGKPPSGRVRSGKAGAAARAKSLTAEERQAIAKQAATARWSGKMKTQLDVARHRLFDAGMLHADNVKLFPGSSRDAPPEKVAEQINKAIAQIEAGDFELVEDFDDD